MHKFQIHPTKNSPAFTLVELIITIVILSILATIAFLSFNSYSSSTRDSVRVSDTTSIKKWLELYQVNSWYYPQPEWTIYTWTINGVDLVYKWIIGNNISEIINISKVPTDPLNTNQNYIYWTTYNKTKYQIATVLENSNSTSYYFNWIGIENIKYKIENNWIKNNWIKNNWITNTTDYTSFLKSNILQLDKALALSNNSNTNNNSRQARVSWMYNWYIKFNSWTNIYLANIPSLIYNSTWVVNLLSSSTYYVTNRNSNLPYTLSNTDIYNNKSGDVIIQEYTNKSWATLTWVDITTIVNTTDSSTRTNLITSMFSWVLLDSFWGDISLITSAVSNNSSSSSNIWCGSDNWQTVVTVPNNLCSWWSASSIIYSTWAGTYTWSCWWTSCKAYDNYTKLLLHFDWNNNNYWSNLWAITNNNVTVNTEGKFSNAAYFNWTSSYLFIPNSADWDFGTSDFTIDFWYYPTSNSNRKNIIDAGDYSGRWIELNYTSDGKSYFLTSPTTNFLASNSAINLNTWTHVALVRQGSNFYYFINGASNGSNSSAWYAVNSNGIWLNIGKVNSTSTYFDWFGWYIDEVRISKWIARRTSPFPQPTNPY